MTDDASKHVIAQMFAWVINQFAPFVPKEIKQMMPDVLGAYREVINFEIAGEADRFLNLVVGKVGGSPAEMAARLIQRPTTPSTTLGNLTFWAGEGAYYLSLMKAYLSARLKTWEYAGNLISPVNMPDPGTAVAALIKGADVQEAVNVLKLLGFDPKTVPVMLDAARQHLSPADYWTLLRRAGKPAGEDFYKRLEKTGLFPDDAKLVDEFLSQLADLQALFRLTIRGEIKEAEFYDRAYKLGFDKAEADSMFKAFQVPLDRSDLDRFFHAGRINKETYLKGLLSTGLRPDDARSISEWPWQPTPPEVVRTLLYRGKMPRDEAAKRVKALGFRADDAAEYVRQMHELLPVDALTDLVRREEITLPEYKNQLALHGFTPEQVEQLAKLIWIVPGPQDVITFAVREAFTPDAIKRFGYDLELPPEFIKWAKKTGISEEVARYYWYAHWRLPGWGEVTEMFHRIKPGQSGKPRDQMETWATDADVDMFLKINDYPTFWRDKLKAISYNPIARVDIRRIYGVGLATEAEVYETNRALGYTPKDAATLTEWIKEEYLPREAALWRDKVLAAFTKGFITQAAARAALDQLPIRKETKDYLIDQALFDIEVHRKELTAATVQTMLNEELITETEARGRLRAYGYLSEEIELFMDLWAIQAAPKKTAKTVTQKKPTLAEFQRFLKKGIIDETTFRVELNRMGYADTYIDMYIADAMGE